MRPATLTLTAALVLGCPAAALASDPVAPVSPPRLAGLTKPIDYPSGALVERREGTVRYRLRINAKGKVKACEVTSSSGSEDLDRATCAGMKGAKFVPARDQNNKAIESVYTGNFRWITPAT